MLLEYIIRVLYASDISSKASIDGGLMIQHGMGIVIGSDVKIGRNCKLYNGITLGNKDVYDPINKQPVLGNNVIIGSGAKCLGNIFIGDNVIVGANSVVLHSISNNLVVAGIPGKIIKKRILKVNNLKLS